MNKPLTKKKTEYHQDDMNGMHPMYCEKTVLSATNWLKKQIMIRVNEINVGSCNLRDMGKMQAYAKCLGLVNEAFDID